MWVSVGVLALRGYEASEALNDARSAELVQASLPHRCPIATRFARLFWGFTSRFGVFQGFDGRLVKGTFEASLGWWFGVRGRQGGCAR